MKDGAGKQGSRASGNEGGELHNGHRQRMREKAQNAGFEMLPPHEAMEMLLYSASPRADTNGVAHELINTFGSVTNVLAASEEELMQVKGVGKHAAEVIRAFGRAVNAYHVVLNGTACPIRTRGEAVAFAEELFNDDVRPQTWLVLIDHGGSVIFTGRIYAGTMWLTEETRAFIVEHALTYHAHFAVIIARRGLQMGSILPSDRRMIQDLARAVTNIGVNVMDYIVVTPQRTISLRRDVETGHSPFDPAEYGRTIHETWLSDPGEVWEADTGVDVEIPDPGEALE